MSYTPPKDALEYQQMFTDNMRIDGGGLDTTVHAPCPFCAAPDFQVYKLLECKDVITNDHTCTECKRTARVEFSVDVPERQVFELVQVGGDDQPDWLTPPFRRR